VPLPGLRASPHFRKIAKSREHIRLLVHLSSCTFELTTESEFTSFGAGKEAIMTEPLNEGAVLHVRFDGRSLDVPLGDLDIGTASEDREIKRALARHIEVPEARLRDYTVDRHDTGNLTVRPEAVFG
jgi:hypothetical protein